MTGASSRNLCCTIASLGLLVAFLHVAERYFDEYTLQIISLVAINIILAVSLNLIYGFTGMFSLGHAGFMAVGAYVCTLLILTPEQKLAMWKLKPILPWLADMSMPFLSAVIMAGIVTAVFGLLIALPVLRLGGDYLGIATLGFAEIIRIIITNATPVTNGALGLNGIPQYATLWWNYGWAVFTVYFVVVLLKSNVGNVFKAIRDDEIAARTMGVNTFFYRVLSFTIGAFFAGVGGALMAAFISTIDPKMFNFMLTFNVLMIVVAGGLGSVTGSVIGSIIITIMLEWLRIVENPFDYSFLIAWLNKSDFLVELLGVPEISKPEEWVIEGIPGMRMVIFSFLLLCIILYRRHGLLGMREFSWDALFNLKLSDITRALFKLPGLARLRRGGTS